MVQKKERKEIKKRNKRFNKYIEKKNEEEE